MHLPQAVQRYPSLWFVCGLNRLIGFALIAAGAFISRDPFG
jgi:hypothetical protein